jgi:pyrroline-5-carboxylate reductase
VWEAQFLKDNMKKDKIGIIGGGNMGEALVKGLYAKHSVYVCETNAPRVKYL